MEKEDIKIITDLGFEVAGKMRRMSGSGSKKSLPLFNLHWEQLVKVPVIDFDKINSAVELKNWFDTSKKEWRQKVQGKISSKLDKLRKKGYTIEDPLLLTEVYQYSSYFIYKN